MHHIGAFSLGAKKQRSSVEAKKKGKERENMSNGAKKEHLGVREDRRRTQDEREELEEDTRMRNG